MSSLAPTHQVLILDACCVINRYGSGRLTDILHSLGQRVAIAEYVYTDEALRVQSSPSVGAKTSFEPIDLGAVVAIGLLEVTAALTEEEETTAVNFTEELHDTGEAVTGAIARHRHWAIGTDDRKAASFFSRVVPQLRLVTTPEIVKHWVDQHNPPSNEVRTMLRHIHLRAHYAPPHRHPLRAWWDQFA